jgi:membrane-associated phospholipid phosphatase
MKFKKFLIPLQETDVIVIVFSVLLIIVDLIFHSRIEYCHNLIGINILVIFFVISISRLSEKYNNIILNGIHNWYIVPIVLLTFKQLYFMIAPIHGKDYDVLLIEIDRWLFGVDPTVWLSKISFPLLTEVVQIAYSSFYFLFIVVGYELYRKKDREKFHYAAFLIVYGFFLSYVGYFFLPAIGPRFTLHNFFAIDLELPGVFLTNYLREFVNLGESITRGIPNPAAIVQRDVFPSGHTQLTLILMFISKKYKMKVRAFIWITGILLIFGTVYLRYHYVVDLLAGAVFMMLTVWSAKYIYDGWNLFKNNISSEKRQSSKIFKQ